MPSQSFIPGFLLTNRARSVFSLARQLADVNSASISPKHVFQALTTSERGNGRIALELCGLDLRTIIDDLQVSKLEKAPH